MHIHKQYIKRYINTYTNKQATATLSETFLLQKLSKFGPHSYKLNAIT